MNVPLIFSFWFMLGAYVIHVIDESLLGGSFVEKVQQIWWPQYSWRKFFWFNTGYFVIMIACAWLPMICVAEAGSFFHSRGLSNACATVFGMCGGRSASANTRRVC